MNNSDPKLRLDVRVFPDSHLASQFAAEWLVRQFSSPGVQNVMLAGGNSPLALYAEVAARNMSFEHLHVFSLDEYVGVPRNEPRNCANLILEKAVRPWRVSVENYHTISSIESEAASSILAHEENIHRAGGLDVVILGLGKNGHIGFNEPGSSAAAQGRLVPLSEISINANREWFSGDFAPHMGVTTGMKTILGSKKILLLAFGTAKAAAVAAMLEKPPSTSCPASFLQDHSEALIVLDQAAAENLQSR